MDLKLFIQNVQFAKIYDKGTTCDFDIANFLYLDGDVPRRISYGVDIYQSIRSARASSNLSDLNCRHKALPDKLPRQGYRYYKHRKAFSKLYHRHSALTEKIWCQSEEISETRYIGTRILRRLTKLKKIIGVSNFSEHFRKLINHLKRIGYS